MSGYEKYVLMKRSGSSANDVYALARSDGLDQVSTIKMLRAVFDLSLDDAKLISFKEDTGDDYPIQEGKDFEQFLQILDEELGLDNSDD